ncbi:MAG: hypothetical protein QOH69_1910 [Actinomycetota bacterium]|jgi:uncharacterized membrane protein|nr:hypothetical protein [Actinomycetota bacterium]
MLIAVWIVSGLLALAYLVAGGTKVFTRYDKIQERMTWTSHAKPWQVNAVGVLEILGAVGLIVPPLTGILPILAPIAASALALLQLFAIVFHVRAGEAKKIGVNVVLLPLAVFVAVVWFAGLA